MTLCKSWGERLFNLACFSLRISHRVPSAKYVVHCLLRLAGIGQKSRELLSPVEAEKLLNSISANPHTSALCTKPPSGEKKYDLQIIVAVYNMGNVIERCLNSVLNQPTQYHCQLVVVNDGSTDDTADILKKYAKDDRLKIISQENRGFSGARNRGLERLNARYITFLDSDDQLMQGSIDALISEADNQKADIVQGGYKLLKNGIILNGSCPSSNHKAKALEFYGYPWGKIFKAELFERIHFPEYYWFEDTIMAMLLFPMARRLYTVSRPVYLYTCNPNGISATYKGKPKALDTYYITQSLLRDARTLGIDTNSEDYLSIMNNQIALNFSRTSAMGIKCREAIFVLTRKMLENVPVKKHHHVLIAAKNGSFTNYQIACMCE